MHGYGQLEWPDGRRYEGEYFEDKKHGFGTFIWPNGSFYQGSWVDGKQHGTGILSKNGTEKTYLWENGKKVQELGKEKSDTLMTLESVSSVQ